MLFPLGTVFHKFLLGRLRKRECRSGGNAEFPAFEEREAGFLDNLGKKVNLAEPIVFGHGAKHSICHLANATLVSHALGQAPV